LRAAFDAAAHDGSDDDRDDDNDDDRALPVGFHSWPAGTAWPIAKHLVHTLARHSDDVVVDPFSGAGTVGLAALTARRAFLGVDLNPLAARVGFQRCRPRSDADAARVEAVVDAVTEASKERVRKKRPSRANVDDAVRAAYLPHTVMELAGLLEEITASDDDDARKLMAVCFSAILTKVSLKRGDTDGSSDAKTGANKKVGRFLPTELFQEKAHELLDAQRALFQRVGLDVPRPRFVVDDARNVGAHLDAGRRADVIVTSPPYGGTYDYAAHHAHRNAWLGLDDSALRATEIGARRRQRDAAAFDDDVRGVLAAVHDVLAADGVAVVLIGDADLAGLRVAADEHLHSLAPAVGLRVVASAAAPRPDWHRDRTGMATREEHLVALVRRR
jgi:hypothetical protein